MRRPKLIVVLNSVGIVALLIACGAEIAQDFSQDVQQLQLHHGVAVYGINKLIEGFHSLKHLAQEAISA